MSLRVGSPLPSLDGATTWLNHEIVPADVKHSPILIYFWAASCPGCLANLPVLNEWKGVYRPYGLRTVAVHLPRHPEDYDLERVRVAIANHGIDDPCAVDNERVIARRFHTGEVWPYYFFFDAEGNLRSRAAGGMGLRLLENTLKRYLATREAAASE